MHITQKLIIKILYSILILFAFIILLRILTIFLPPAILFTTYRQYDTTNRNAQITLWGLGFGKDTHNNKLFLNEIQVAHDDINTWSNIKISFNIRNTEKKIAILSLEIQNKKSNRKPIVLIDKNTTNTATSIQKKKFEHYNNDFILTTSEDSIQNIYMPLLFNTEGEGQCSAAYYTVHSQRYPIPYNRYFQERNVYTLFLEPSLLFSNPQDIEIEMQCETQIFSFDMAVTPIPEDNAHISDPYLINVAYQPMSEAHAYMIPISSHYQHVKIKNSVFSDMQYTQEVIFSNIILQNYSVEIKNKTRTNFLEQDPPNAPFLSQNLDSQSPLNYLFDIMLSPAELASLEKTLVSTTPEANITIPVDLDILTSDATQETIEQYVVSLNNYITQLLSLIDTITLENIHTLLPNAALYKLDAITADRRYKNTLTASILRTQGLIARTVVGEIAVFSADTTSKETLTTQPMSWVEVLTDRKGWVPINFSQKNYIALYVIEKYYLLHKNNQLPLTPYIKKISLITQK